MVGVAATPDRQTGWPGAAVPLLIGNHPLPILGGLIPGAHDFAVGVSHEQIKMVGVAATPDRRNVLTGCGGNRLARNRLGLTTASEGLNDDETSIRRNRFSIAIKQRLSVGIFKAGAVVGIPRMTATPTRYSRGSLTFSSGQGYSSNN